MALSFLTYLSKGEKYMPGTWSISTTVRNPERIILFLRVLSRFEGETFDPDTQALFFKELIKTKLYLPNRIRITINKNMKIQKSFLWPKLKIY